MRPRSYCVALRCSEPKQPPRLSKVYRPADADAVQAGEMTLGVGVAFRSEAQLVPPGL